MNYRVFYCGLISVALAAPTLAPAQQPMPDSTAPVPLEPLIVTVLRTPFPLTEIPYAVAVNTEREIQRGRPGLALDEALRGIPGVQVDNRFNYALGERISIRGFGARAQFGVRGVKVLLDGIPATMPDGQTTLNHVDLGSLARAEVIRGPASALYGNAAGGVIQLQSELPPPVPLRGEVKITAGVDGLVRLAGEVAGRSGPLHYRANAARLEFDGVREFSAAENNLLGLQFGYLGARDNVLLAVHAVDYDAQNPGSLSDSLLRVDRSQAFARNVAQRTGERGRHGQAGVRWTHARDAGEWEVAGYLLSRELDNPIPFTVIDLERRAGGVRALFRARPLPVAALQWTVGIAADAQRDNRLNFANRAGERGDLRLDQRETVANRSVFAQIAAEPLPRVALLGGLRYDRFLFSVDDRLVTANNPDDSGDRTLDAVSPSVGVTYTASAALNLYANVATAFETPTTTELANRPSGAGGFNPELEPQRTLSFEVGAKGRAADIVYQAAAYRARVRDALIPFEVASAPGRQFFRNAGSAVHQGVEIGANTVWNRAWRARAAYTWTDAVFDDFATAQARFDGSPVPGVSPHRLEALLGYQHPAGWYADAESLYSAAIPVNNAATAQDLRYSSAYALLNVRAGHDALRIARAHFAPFVGIRNLLDRDYNASVIVNAFGGRYFEPGPGRSVYAGAKVTLGR